MSFHVETTPAGGGPIQVMLVSEPQKPRKILGWGALMLVTETKKGCMHTRTKLTPIIEW